MVIFLGQTLFVTSFGLKTSGHSRTKDRNWPFICLDCQWVLAKCVYWYLEVFTSDIACIYLPYASGKLSIDFPVSSGSHFSLLFLKKAKFEAKTSWANFWKAATLWRFPGSPSYLSLDSLSLNFPIVAWFHNLFCRWWQWLMMTIANIPKLPILPFLINLSENHTWICFKMGYIQRQLDRFSN